LSEVLVIVWDKRLITPGSPKLRCFPRLTDPEFDEIAHASFASLFA
jgi:hypothetical protein